MALASVFGNQAGNSSTQQTPTYQNIIGGVTFDPSKYTQEETPIGVDTWSNAFSGLDQYGLGAFGSISANGGYNPGGPAPTSFTIRRENPNGDPMAYQNRQMNINPDGTVSWGGDWTDAQRVSNQQFALDGLALALAGTGAAGYLGNAIAGGAGAAAGGLSGMDLAADAALGTGNNITTAGSLLSGSGMAGTGIPALQQLPGYGNNIANLAQAGGGSPFTGAVGDVAGSGLLPGTGTSGLQLGGQTAGSIYGTGEGLAIAPEAIGAASGGTGLGSMIGSTIPAASSLPGFLGATSTGAMGGGTGIGAGIGSSIPSASTLPGATSALPGLTGGLGNVGSGVGNNIVQDLVKNLIGGSSGGVSNLGNLASLFTNYNQYNKMGDLINEIKGIYSPDGAYAKYMGDQLARKDAAAGRNSQYGPRLAQLMGILGEGQARSLSGLFQPLQQQQGGLNGMVGAGQRLLQGSGLADMIQKALTGGSQGGMLAGELGQTPSMWDRAGDNVDWESLFGG